eukprot:1053887-Prorocentrum_minimum.AAC.2
MKLSRCSSSGALGGNMSRHIISSAHQGTPCRPQIVVLEEGGGAGSRVEEGQRRKEMTGQ